MDWSPIISFWAQHKNSHWKPKLTFIATVKKWLTGHCLITVCMCVVYRL